MNVFKDYAHYYDLLYQDKDYEGEAHFIRHLISNYSPNAKTILELGSGTGRHAKLLAQAGFRVHGVERSPEMLAQCQVHCDSLSQDLREALDFTQGDLRTCDIKQSFDTVISLFHVISYQISNEDLIAAFRTARKHLNPGGIFIFDVWYGPAVLHTPPEIRIKRIENEAFGLIRIAEPNMHINDNIVDVNYQILMQEKGSTHWNCFSETHHMRYLFQPELALLLQMADFDLLETCEWLTGQEIGTNTWGACFVAQAH
jgi:SAM-dependent methyltransferase